MRAIEIIVEAIPAWFGRRWTSFVTWCRTPTKATKGSVLLGRLVLAVLFTIVYFKFDTYNKEQRDRVAFEAEQRDFDTRHRQWETDSANYKSCVESVDRGLALRAQLFDQANKSVIRWANLADAIAPDDPEANAFLRQIGISEAEDIRSGPLLTSEPKVIEDCPVPGPEPTQPLD